MLAGYIQGNSRDTPRECQEVAEQRLPQITRADHPTALDIGCADGTHSRVLSALGYAVTGVDFSAPMISRGTRALQTTRRCHNKPSLLHGEFLSGRYVDEHGTDTLFDGARFDLVLATAFVHLFPPEADEDALRKVLSHVAPGGTALISTTVEPTNRTGARDQGEFERRLASRWRNRYTFETFDWLVREAARDMYGRRDSSNRGSSSTRRPREGSGSTRS